MDNYQRILFPYAYNILGSAEDAKDTIQDVMAKYLSQGSHKVENEKAYLVRGVINQSINVKKRKSREISSQVWLPEPIATEYADTPIERKDVLTYSMLVLLEKLNPRERAVFILREAFDYSHKEIAEAFECSTENARSILSRAKKKLSGHREQKSRPLRSSDAQSFLSRYIEIIQKGDTKALEQLMADDICIKADGGKKVNVVREITIGKTAATELMLLVYKRFQSSQSIKISFLNHQPALLFYHGNRLKSCQVFELSNGKISQIYSVIDPEKLSISF